MDGIENMRAFLTVSRTHSFIDAARRLGVSPSVVTKRVNQLEWQLHTRLLQRTTRSVQLTDEGERQLPAIQQLVRAYEELVAGVRERPEAVAGTLRVSAPAAMATVVLGRPLAAFHLAFPAVTLDIVVLDRSVNPIEEGFDVALVVLPAMFDGVVEEILCAYPRVLCAAPDYLRRAGTPEHPRDLAHHTCISFAPSGSSWTFQGPSGPVQVAVRPSMSATDSRMIIELVRQGAGISVLSTATVIDGLRDGSLVQVLPDHPMPDLQAKAFVPERRRHLARVEAFVRHMREGLRSQEAHWRLV